MRQAQSCRCCKTASAAALPAPCSLRRTGACSMRSSKRSTPFTMCACACARAHACVCVCVCVHELRVDCVQARPNITHSNMTHSAVTCTSLGHGVLRVRVCVHEARIWAQVCARTRRQILCAHIIPKTQGKRARLTNRLAHDTQEVGCNNLTHRRTNTHTDTRRHTQTHTDTHRHTQTHTDTQTIA